MLKIFNKLINNLQSSSINFHSTCSDAIVNEKNIPINSAE